MAFVQALAVVARGAGVHLLVLFGSRARGAAHARSDWDFGFLADGQFDVDLLRGRFMRILSTDRIDIVDLAKASALLRFRVAVEGTAILEGTSGAFQEFQIDAARFWCDVEPALRRTYARILEEVKAA